MLLTGQPFVDLGMAVAALHAKKGDVSDVTEADLRNAVNWMNAQINPIKSHLGSVNRLKILPAYWQNNPLAGHNMGVNGQNVPVYRKVLEGLTAASPKTYSG